MLASICSVNEVFESDTIVIDCRFDLSAPGQGEREYLQLHIKGARYWHLDQHLCGQKNGLNGRHPLPDLPQWRQFLQSQGIGPASRVVVYDASGGCYAARAWWMLHWAGVAKAYVLDGGWQAWLAADRVVENGPSTAVVSPVAAHWPELPGMPLMTVDQLSAALTQLQVVDARAAARYAGEVEPLDPVAGHIPGAFNRFYQHNLDSPTGMFLSADRLRADWHSLIQRAAGRPLVMQCGSGVTACHNVLAMAFAGFPPSALYAGSWSEWCADPERPVATGRDEA